MLAGYLGNYSRYEIERKYLLRELPDSLPEYYVDIDDLYLKDSSLRLRVERSPSGEIVGRKLTKKDKAIDKGVETSVITSLYLSEGDLISLGQLNGATLMKRRYIQELPEQRVVYDVFHGELEGLIMVEVEFKDYEALSSFKPENSRWEEVTGNPDYSGGRLAFRSQRMSET